MNAIHFACSVRLHTVSKVGGRLAFNLRERLAVIGVSEEKIYLAGDGSGF